MLGMRCLAETEFWADLDAYRTAKSRAKVIARELDSLKQKKSAIAERTALFGKHLLDHQLAHGIDEDDACINPWYMPDLLMETDLLEKERHLKQTSLGLEQAQAVAVSGEKALVSAGLLEHRGPPDGDGIDPNSATGEARTCQDGNATPSHNHLLDPLRVDLSEAAEEFIVAAELFYTEEYRKLTQDELDNLPQPVSEEDKGAALFKKLQEQTKACKAVDAKYRDVLQRARDAGISVPAAAAQDDDVNPGFSPNRSYEFFCSPSLKARMRANAQPIIDRWKAYDQERESAPLPSVEHAAVVSAVPENGKSLRSISFGHSERNEGSYKSDHIVEMRSRTEQLRSLEQGELVMELCSGAMVKRPFENPENDQHMSNMTADEIVVDDDHSSRKNVVGRYWQPRSLSVKMLECWKAGL